MRLGVAVAVVLFGCGSSRLRAEYEAAPVRVAVPEPDAEPGPARDSIVEGDVRDDQTHEPVVGCTVVVVASATGHEEVGITDEDGRFRVAVPAGPIEVTFFLNALKVTAGGSLVASPAEPI